MLYNSDRNFQVWAYSASHSFLLLRSPNNEQDEEKALKEGFNIDIEFVGVGYLDLPVLLHGISIKEIKTQIPTKFHKLSTSTGYKLFEITSEGNVYNIVAGSFQIGKNNWLNEDRIINPFLEYEEILVAS